MALQFDGSSARVVYSNIGNLNSGAKSILLDFFLPTSASQTNNDFFSATRNSGPDTFQNFLLQMSDEGGTINSIRAAHFGAVTGQAYTTSDVLTVGQWNRIVWTCSDCAAPSVLNTKIYVNAVSQAFFGGSTGAGLGATNGDICIGNRAHLDRGVNGQIARFAVVNRVVNEAEIAEFELGLNLGEIFSSEEFLLKPNTVYLANWDSVIGGSVNAATLSGTSQIQDPTYGLASASTLLSTIAQNLLATRTISPGQSTLVGHSSLSGFSQSSNSSVVPATNIIEIIGSLDGGTIDEAASTVELLSTDALVTLVPRKFSYRASGKHWLTMQARINNVDSANSIQFSISELDFDLGQNFTPETKLWWRPALGTKQDWSLFENHVLANGVLTASNNASFSAKDIYVGDQPGYYYADISSDVSEWLASPYVNIPSGADTDGSISTLTSIADENGRFSGSLKQHAIKISDDAPPVHPELNKKIRILAFANIHSGEMVGKWAVKGFIDWLTSESVKASHTRRNFEVFVVWVNATGLFLGHPVGSELTGAFADKNLNRDWGDFNLEATGKARDWITTHLGNEVEYVIDFHNLTWSSDDRIFRDPTSISIAFSNAVDANYAGSITQQGNSASSGFTTFYFKQNFDINGATLEPRRGTNSLSDYQQFGAAAGEALQDMLTGGAFGRFARANARLPYVSTNAFASSEQIPGVRNVAFVF